MSKIKQLTNKKFKGSHSFKFKAGGTTGTFFKEEMSNIQSIQLFIISNEKEVFIGPLFPTNPPEYAESHKMLNGEEYLIKAISAGQLERTKTGENEEKNSHLAIGIHWN